MRPEEQQLAFDHIAQIKKMLADRKDPPKPAPALVTVPPVDDEPF